jgi:hypothetical protein
MTTEPGFIWATVSALNSVGALRPGISAVVMTISACLALVHGLGLALHPAGRHGPRVTADTDGAFALFVGLVGHVDELGAEGFDLLFHRGAHVRRFDHGTQTFRRGNACKPGHAGAENQHARRFHGTCSGHQHRHEARIVMSGQQHGFIAGNVGLRGQHIQALGAGGTRCGLERERGHAALGHFGDGFIVERVEHAHHNGAALDQRQLAVAGRDHLKNQLRTKRIVGAANDRACRFISTVDNTGVNAGAALDGDSMALANEFFTVSGVAATRVSPACVSRVIPICTANLSG